MFETQALETDRRERCLPCKIVSEKPFHYPENRFSLKHRRQFRITSNDKITTREIIEVGGRAVAALTWGFCGVVLFRQI